VTDSKTKSLKEDFFTSHFPREKGIPPSPFWPPLGSDKACQKAQEQNRKPVILMGRNGQGRTFKFEDWMVGIISEDSGV
jgi:hypothetical protein